MNNPSSSREAHLVFCPRENFAQHRAGEYIASLQPARVYMATNYVAETTRDMRQPVQDVYDSITSSVDIRDAMGRPIAESSSDILAETTHIPDELRQTFADAAQPTGPSPDYPIPFLPLVMKLKGSGIPVVLHDSLHDVSVLEGGSSEYSKTLEHVNEAIKSCVQTPNGEAIVEGEILRLRRMTRVRSSVMSENITQLIKQLPQESAPDDKTVIIIDNEQLYPLRRSRPSMWVKMAAHSFSSPGAQGRAGRTGRFLDRLDYISADEVAQVNIGLGLTREPSADLKTRLEARAVNLGLLLAIDAVGHFNAGYMQALSSKVSEFDNRRQPERSREMLQTVIEFLRDQSFLFLPDTRNQ